MQLTFFGVRGSCPCAGDEYRVGGNTSCCLLSAAGEPPLILDLGTGLRALGDAVGPELRAEGRRLEASALLTHLHFDHILGLPFFAPLLDPAAVLHVHGPRQQCASLEETVGGGVQPPFFPVHMRELPGEVRFHDTGDEDFAVGGFKVRARVIPHPGTTLGFRVEADGRSVAYVPDHQAPLDRRQVAEAVLELCDGVDLVVHDAQYTDDEFADRSTWGHSTVAYALQVAAEAGARRLALFHHDPWHRDHELERLLHQGRRSSNARRLDEVVLAREGGTVDLGRAGVAAAGSGRRADNGRASADRPGPA